MLCMLHQSLTFNVKYCHSARHWGKNPNTFRCDRSARRISMSQQMGFVSLCGQLKPTEPKTCGSNLLHPKAHRVTHHDSAPIFGLLLKKYIFGGLVPKGKWCSKCVSEIRNCRLLHFKLISTASKVDAEVTNPFHPPTKFYFFFTGKQNEL